MCNEKLNKLEIYKNKVCNNCKRKYPEIILNIEGYIHHNSKLICLDIKNCHKFMKNKNFFKTKNNNIEKFLKYFP